MGCGQQILVLAFVGHRAILQNDDTVGKVSDALERGGAR
jgi:hypothetical protein